MSETSRAPKPAPGQLAAPDDSALPTTTAANGAAPFVTTLRARPATIRVGNGDGERITLRVQMPEVWDAVRLEVSPHEPVLSLKVAALRALFPDGEFHEDFVLKLNGFEVLDETAAIRDVGATDGSIFLLTHRRRRPVR